MSYVIFDDTFTGTANADLTGNAPAPVQSGSAVYGFLSGFAPSLTYVGGTNGGAHATTLQSPGTAANNAAYTLYDPGAISNDQTITMAATFSALTGNASWQVRRKSDGSVFTAFTMDTVGNLVSVSNAGGGPSLTSAAFTYSTGTLYTLVAVFSGTTLVSVSINGTNLPALAGLATPAVTNNTILFAHVNGSGGGTAGTVVFNRLKVEVAQPTTATLAGPSSGTTGSASTNFTVTLGSAVPVGGQGLAVTLSDAAGSATFAGTGVSGTTLVIPSGGTVATFTDTRTISATGNVGTTASGVSFTPTNVAYTTTSGGGPTSATFTGPSTGTTGSPSGVFTVSLNVPSVGGTTVTLADAAGGATFAGTGVSGSTLTIGAGQSVGTFTDNRASSATGNISVTSGGITFTPSTIAYTTSSASATAFALTGPSSGYNHQASSNFTFTPNGVYTGTITPAMTGLAGAWSPTSLTWTGDGSAKTSAFTPSALGSGNANGTGSPSLTAPSNVAYTSNPPTLAVSPGTATASDGGSAVAITATLTGSSAGLTAALSGLGSLSTTSPTSGVSFNYTPPGSGTGTATVTVTESTDSLSQTCVVSYSPSVNTTYYCSLDNVTPGVTPTFVVHTMTGSVVSLISGGTPVEQVSGSGAWTVSFVATTGLYIGVWTAGASTFLDAPKATPGTATVDTAAIASAVVTALATAPVGSVAGDITGKVLGGGSGAISGVGAFANSYVNGVAIRQGNGTAAAVAAGSLTLDSADPAATANLAGWQIEVISATAGAGQVATIASSNTGTHVQTLTANWTTTPTGTVVYGLNPPVVGGSGGGSGPTVTQIRQEMDANSTKLANITGAVATAAQIPANLTAGTFSAPGVFATSALANSPTGGSAPTVTQIRQEMDANSTKLANLDAAVSTRSTFAGGAVSSVTGAVGSVTAGVGLAPTGLDNVLIEPNYSAKDSLKVMLVASAAAITGNGTTTATVGTLPTPTRTGTTQITATMANITQTIAGVPTVVGVDRTATAVRLSTT